jgi:hypothetical protein
MPIIELLPRKIVVLAHLPLHYCPYVFGSGCCAVMIIEAGEWNNAEGRVTVWAQKFPH